MKNRYLDIIFLIGGVLVAPAQSNHLPPVFAFSFGRAGAGPGQLNFPLGMALDNAGHIYVCDTMNKRIQKFDSNGVYLAQWGNANLFSWPDGVALDSVGNIFVADNSSNRVDKFSPAGVLLTNWNSYMESGTRLPLMFPGAVAVDASNQVYVADYPGIQTYGDDGAFRTNLVNQQQNAVALGPAGVLYVMWTGNSVSEYTTAGGFVTQWGTQGTNAGQFKSAQGLAVDTNGNVYVADSSNNRIQMFNQNGNFLVQWGTYGTDAGQFNFPCRVAVDPAGKYVYVADSYNNRIQVFSFLPGFLVAAPISNSAAFAFEVNGLEGCNYIVQASSNMLDWVSLQTNPVPFTFVDTNSADFARRFYRSVFSQ